MAKFPERVLHVDMDAFFVEVERLADPTLVGVPVAVGGLGGRGVVASASYEARQRGVRSAMPISEARRHMPNGRFVIPDHDAYRAVSAQMFEILRSFTPFVEGLSVDEAFLDIGGLSLHYEGAADVASAVRLRIRDQLGLPASAGVGTTKLIAKLASERAKPDGQLVVARGTELEFLHPMGVRALWGVGEATFAALEGLGVHTVGELADLSEKLVRRRLGDAVGGHLWALAHNVDDRVVTPGGEAKSISAEATFPHDLVDPSDMDEQIFRLCVAVSYRLRRAEMAARTISVKVRYSDFATINRSHTTEAAVDLTTDIYATATQLMRRAGVAGRSVRLLGVSGSALVASGEPRQLGLGSERAQALAAASDTARQRYGEGAVKPARLVSPPDTERT